VEEEYDINDVEYYTCRFWKWNLAGLETGYIEGRRRRRRRREGDPLGKSNPDSHRGNFI